MIGQNEYVIRVIAQSNVGTVMQGEAAAVSAATRQMSAATAHSGAAQARASNQQAAAVTQTTRSMQGGIKMAHLYKAAFGLYATKAVLDFTGAIVEQGRVMDVTTKAFEHMSRGMGGSGALMRQFKSDTGGIITNLDLMREGTKFLTAEFTTNNVELSRALELATKLGSLGRLGAGQGGRQLLSGCS